MTGKVAIRIDLVYRSFTFPAVLGLTAINIKIL